METSTADMSRAIAVPRSTTNSGLPIKSSLVMIKFIGKEIGRFLFASLKIASKILILPFRIPAQYLYRCGPVALLDILLVTSCLLVLPLIYVLMFYFDSPSYPTTAHRKILLNQWNQYKSDVRERFLKEIENGRIKS